MQNVLKINREIIQLMTQLEPLSKDGKKQWWSVTLMALAGSCYSLGQACAISGASRSYDKQIKKCMEMMKFIEGKQGFNIPNQQRYKPWLVGYYMNNAEMRSQSAFERFLISFQTKKNVKKATGAIKEIIQECPICGKNPINGKCYPETYRIIKEYLQISDDITNHLICSEKLFDYRKYRSKAVRIKRVWLRCNSFKHHDLPLSDPQNTRQRLYDVSVSLLAIVNIYRECARHAGILSIV